jgi:hypothetical protein
MPHGPYHRVESPTQTPDDAVQQVVSGEIWGRAAKQGGLFLCVKAYPGALPAGKRGIRFTTAVPHDRRFSSPTECGWYHPETPGVILRTTADEDFAAIPAHVINSQS